MRVLDRLRTWLRPAEEAARSETRLACLPAGLRLYAIGDIHGESRLLDGLAVRIGADLDRDPPQEARAVFLGDYIDRGPESCAVIQRLASGDFPVPFVALRGNHEDLMLDALRTREGMRPWCGSGGLQTLRSYGLDPGDAPRGKALGKLRDALLRALPPRHGDFLIGTRLSLTVGDYFFAHAGARPGVALDRQAAHDLMWIRDECYRSSYDFGKVLVHGHTPRKQPENLDRRINVDTGAYRWKVLSAVVLEGTTRRFLSAAAGDDPPSR